MTKVIRKTTLTKTTATITSSPTTPALYVSTTGNDANAGTLSSPLRTISQAARLAIPGTTVIVRGGTYNEAVTISSSGTAAANIAYKPYSGETVVLSGSSLPAKTDVVSIYGNYIQFQGFEVTNASNHGIIAWGNHDVSIVGNSVHGSWSGGIWVGGDTVGQSHDNLIQNNTVYNNVLQNQARTSSSGWSQGISAADSDGTRIIGNNVYQNYGEGIGSVQSNRVEISANTVHDCYSANIYLDNAPNSVVNANFLYSSGDQGFFTNGHAADGIAAAIETYSLQRPLSGLIVTNNIDVGDRSGFYYGNYGHGGGMQNALIASNTFVNETGEAINLDIDAGHSGNRVVDDIFYRAISGTLATGSSSAATFDHNDWYGGYAGLFSSPTDIVANPMLVKPGSFVASDYRLQSNSPALTSGTALPQVTTDYFGVVRTAPSTIGAY